jgi:[ribosomal protein S18]-alanine N-acetyltransferase
MTGLGESDFAVVPMEERDIPQVVAIDQLSFANPWSAESYHYELVVNQASHFWVLLAPTPPAERQVVGYAGFWLIVDEAHIGTVAIHPLWRRRGLGEKLLVRLLGQARDLGAVLATLEVRAGNRVAQRLYERHGFVQVGRRKKYYQDNGEDALLLTVRFPLEAGRAEGALGQS